MNSEKIGNFIRELRYKSGLSQNKLAEMIPISRQAVSKWERGFRFNLSIPQNGYLNADTFRYSICVD